jgi:hypothetical protein
MTTTPLARLVCAVDPLAARYELGKRLWRLVCAAEAAEPPRPDGDVRRATFFSFGVRFEPNTRSLAQRRWPRTMRGALEVIEAAEGLRRAALVSHRVTLPRLTDVSSYEARVRARAVTMREEAIRETADAPERYAATLRAKLATLRAELPSLHAQLRRVRAQNDAIRFEHVRSAGAEAASRARSAAVHAALLWLETIAGEPIVVAGLDAIPPRLDDPARATDFLRAIAVVARDLPRASGTIAV